MPADRFQPWEPIDDAPPRLYLEWLVEEAGGVLRADTLTHYAIYTPEDCIDIVTEFPPTAEWLNG